MTTMKFTAGLRLGASALAIVTALGAAPALAQTAALNANAASTAQSVITGRVSDRNGAGLPGARVTVRETGAVVATDRQGRYILPWTTTGQATLEVDYLGLPTATRVIDATAGVANVADIVVADATEVAEIVIIGSISDGQARALNQQRTADNTINVVSADSIGRFPDSNIAEALQRVPGIGVERDQGEGNFISLRGAPSEFTSVTVDGVSIPGSWPDTRAVDLGTIPSDAVSSLEISKTLLPHQDADSIAGSVNLVTRSAFDNPRLSVRANAGMSYNEFGGGNDQRASFSVSNVFGPERQFGASLSASWSETERQLDNIESYWDVVERPEGGEVLGIPEQEYKDYDTNRERISLTGALEYRPDPTNRFFLRGTWARRIDDEFRNLLAIVYEEGPLQPGATDLSATWNNTRYVREFRHRIIRDETYAVSAGGEHALPGFTVDYTVSAARAEQTYPRRQQLVFRSGGADGRPDVTYDFRDDHDLPYISLFETGEHLNIDSYDFRQHTVRWQDTLQDEVAAAANITVPTTLFGRNAEWRFGARVRDRDIESDEENYRDRNAGSAPALSLAELLGPERSQNFTYHLGNKVNSGLVLDYFQNQAAASAMDGNRRVPESTTTDYSAAETIYAAYGMTRIELDRTDLILGLRVEHTEFEGSAPSFNTDTETFTLNHASNSYTEWFPNLTLRHAFSDNLIGRFALSRGIARPRYRDNVPRVAEDSDGSGSTVEVDQGNPDLRATLSNNVDAGIEYYFEPLGVVSAGIFYKDLTDYVFTLETSGTYNGDPARITQPHNADGRIFGIELNYQQQFTFLPGWLSGFGVFANVTWTDAEMTLPQAVAGRSDTVTLPKHSDTTMNLAVFYENSRFNARLAWTDRSDYLATFHSDARLDTYWEGREQLDFTTAYDVTDNVNLYLEAKNLTNSRGVRYVGARERVTELEEFGYTVFVGARLNF